MSDPDYMCEKCGREREPGMFCVPCKIKEKDARIAELEARLALVATPSAAKRKPVYPEPTPEFAAAVKAAHQDAAEQMDAESKAQVKLGKFLPPKRIDEILKDHLSRVPGWNDPPTPLLEEPTPAPVADAGLLPCPWCGEIPEIDDDPDSCGVTIYCPNKKCWFAPEEYLDHEPGNYNARAALIKIWNARAPRPSLADDPAAFWRAKLAFWKAEKDDLVTDAFVRSILDAAEGRVATTAAPSSHPGECRHS